MDLGPDLIPIDEYILFATLQQAGGIWEGSFDGTDEAPG